jgi:hypothetical protein
LTTHVKLLLAALSVLLLVLFAACGGDDDDDSGDDAGNATATAADATQEDDGDEPAEETEPADDGDDGGDNESDDDGDGGSGTHACELLTPEEVSAAVGFEVGEGRDYLAVSSGTQCEWPFTDGGVIYGEVLAEGGADFYEAVTFGSDAEELDGIGDEALFDSLGLQVVDGDRYVAIQNLGPGEDPATSVALAQALLDAME